MSHYQKLYTAEDSAVVFAHGLGIEYAPQSAEATRSLTENGALTDTGIAAGVGRSFALLSNISHS